MKVRQLLSMFLSIVMIASISMSFVCCESRIPQQMPKHEIGNQDFKWENPEDNDKIVPLMDDSGIMPIPNLPKWPRNEYDNPFVPPNKLSVWSEVPDLRFEIFTDGQTKQTSIWKYLDQTKSKALIVELWAVWCQPCKAEMPYLEALSREFRSKGLNVIGLSIDLDETNAKREIVEAFKYDPGMEESWTKLGKYKKTNNSYVSFPIDFDHNRKISRTLNIKSIPTTLIITADHKIHYFFTGFDDKKMKNLEFYVKDCLSIK